MDEQRKNFCNNPNCLAPLRPDGYCIQPFAKCFNGWQRADERPTAAMEIPPDLLGSSIRSDRPPPMAPPSTPPPEPQTYRSHRARQREILPALPAAIEDDPVRLPINRLYGRMVIAALLIAGLSASSLIVWFLR